VHKIHTLSYSLTGQWEQALDGWVTYLTAAGTSAATRRLRRSHIRCIAKQLGHHHPNEVTTDDLLSILGQPNSSLEHRRSRRASLVSFYRWCAERGLVEQDPTSRLPRVRTAAGVPRPAPDEVWHAVLTAAEPRVVLMARLAGEAGLRRAEVACVHTNDLVVDAGGWALIVHGKGGKQRVLPITISLFDAIMKQSRGGGYLFPGAIDGHISADRVGHLVSRAMPHPWSMHKLRHRFATRGYAGTGNLRAVQEALGHTSVATTQRYTAVSSEQIRCVFEAAV
jgi:site-specific recombinase XerD